MAEDDEDIVLPESGEEERLNQDTPAEGDEKVEDFPGEADAGGKTDKDDTQAATPKEKKKGDKSVEGGSKCCLLL
jgi:hypothetical protein